MRSRIPVTRALLPLLVLGQLLLLQATLLGSGGLATAVALAATTAVGTALARTATAPTPSSTTTSWPPRSPGTGPMP